MPKSMTVTGLTHDLVRRRSIVSVVWDDDSEKHLALPVTYGCDLNSVREEAERAVRGVSAELKQVAVSVPK